MIRITIIKIVVRIIFSDSEETGSSAIVLNHFHIIHKSISFIKNLFLSFS